MGGEPSRSRRGNSDVESAERHVGGDAEGNSVARVLVFLWGVVWGLIMMNWLWPYVRRLAARPLAALSRGCRLVWSRHNGHAVDDRSPLASRGREDSLPDQDSASAAVAAHPPGGRQRDEDLRDTNRVVNRTTVVDGDAAGSIKPKPSGSEDAAPPPHPDDDDVPPPLPTVSGLVTEQTVTWSPTPEMHSKVPTPPPPGVHSEVPGSPPPDPPPPGPPPPGIRSEASAPPPSAGPQVASEGWVCALPGCSRPCYVEASGRIHDYCGRTHAMRHKNMLEGRHLFSFAPAPMVDTGSGPVLFYNRDEPYYEFTNFYRAKIKLDGKVWPTTEHYFQAQKFIGTPYVEQIRKLEAPRMAFSLSRNPQVARWRREDWEQEKVNVMYKALLAKFSQHERLRSLLLGTGHRELIEHSPYDRFWGDGGDRTGENMLGRLLMKVRADLLGETMDIPLPSYLLPQQPSGVAGGREFFSLPTLGTPAFETESPTSLHITTAAVSGYDAALVTSGASGAQTDAEFGVPGPVEGNGENTGNTAALTTDVEESTHASTSVVDQAVVKQEETQEPPGRVLEDLSTNAAECNGTLPADSAAGSADPVPSTQDNGEENSTTNPHSATPVEVPVPSTVSIPATESQSQLQACTQEEEKEGQETRETEVVERGERKEQEEEEVKEEGERKIEEEEEEEKEEKEEEEEEEGEEEEENHEVAVGNGEQGVKEGEGEEVVKKEKLGEIKESEERMEEGDDHDREREEDEEEAEDKEKEGEKTEDRNAAERSFQS